MSQSVSQITACRACFAAKKNMHASIVTGEEVKRVKEWRRQSFTRSIGVQLVNFTITGLAINRRTQVGFDIPDIPSDP